MTERNSALHNSNEQLRAANLHLKEEQADKRQSKTTLMDSEARYWHLFDNMRSGVAIYEANDNGHDFVFVGLNRAAEQISNNKREDLIGRSILDLFPIVDEFGLLDIFQRVWKSGQPEHHPATEFREGTFSGWVETYVYKLPSGEIVAIFDDVTARMVASELFRQQKALLERIIEALDHPFCVINTSDYRVEMANSTAWNQAGPLGSETCHGLSHMSDRPCNGKNHPCPLRQVVRTGEPVTMEHIHYDADGKTRTIEVHAYPLFDDDGKVTSIVECTLDIADRKRAGEAIIAGTASGESERITQDLHTAITQTRFSADLVARFLSELLEHESAELRRNSAKVGQLINAATFAALIQLPSPPTT